MRNVIKRFALVWLTSMIVICSYPLGAVAAPAPQATKEKRIVLTFDDGPHPKQTLQILDLLDRYGIKATFFMIGINVETYPQVAYEVAARGHEVGNHTETHSHAIRMDNALLQSEIAQCEREVLARTGKQCKLFRPPEGALTDSMRSTIKSMGYINVLWTLDTRDWAHTPPDQISEYILQNAKNGDIILMHDYIGYNSPTLKALETFVPVLLEQGFTFVTAGELLKSK